jgi:N-acetyl-gamma-glutamyl-phosphate reductase
VVCVPRVAVVGAAGCAGALCAAIVERHPGLELVAITARSDAGLRLEQVYPRHRVGLELESFDADRVAERAEAALVAYPHGAAAPVVQELLARGLKVVDLSADFRLDRARYERYYGPHAAPALLEGAVYGLPEIGHREQVREADLVAGPGCYPTAALLALWPLREVTRDAIVDAKSGVSGAGREATGTTHFVSVAENVNAYKVDGHRHRAELEHELVDGEGGFPITFTPHLLPIDQGLLASCYVTPSRELTSADVRELFAAAYGDEPFVELAATPPGVRDVRETNLCRLHATVEPATGRVLAFAAIDNLWKGAASQAVQDLNLMLGLPEEQGLGVTATHRVAPAPAGAPGVQVPS